MYVVGGTWSPPRMFIVDAKEVVLPIVGCVAYRGYSRKQCAPFLPQDCVQRSRRHGGGVAAYSTLGNFNDPVLNTMMGWSDVELAAIIFSRPHPPALVRAERLILQMKALATTVEASGGAAFGCTLQGRDARYLAIHLVQQDHYAKVVDPLERDGAPSCARFFTPPELRLN